MRILLVEDSERVAASVTSALNALGHSIVVAGSVRLAEEAFLARQFDVAIIDVGLPDGCGLEWCRSVRRAGSALPILLLTARNTVADRVSGLDAGADDYLGKPFSTDELAARVRALVRRGPRWTESVRRFGRVTIDRDRRVVLIDDTPVPLTAREFDIVSLLAWRDGRVVSRDDVLESLWGEATEGASASFDVLLARVRRKFAEKQIDDALRTVRQVGYAWALERSKSV